VVKIALIVALKTRMTGAAIAVIPGPVADLFDIMSAIVRKNFDQNDNRWSSPRSLDFFDKLH
jgi:hypothetical protein